MKLAQILLGAIFVSMAAGLVVRFRSGTTVRDAMTAASVGSSVEGELASLRNATGWLNSQPLAPRDLRGKIVLIDFWTYTCINWIRTAGYVRAWAGKYQEHGLVVVSVHSPEFSFEKNIDNVQRAAQDLRIDHPIAIDNDFVIWRAFGNRYWPALYVVDGSGRIRHHQFGEGEYEQAERIIQRLLAEAGAHDIPDELVSVDTSGVEAAADWRNLGTPETYVGYGRTENFSSPGGPARDKRRVYTAPARLSLNHWALEGDWTMKKEAAVLNDANGRIVYRFHARDLHVVMGPTTPGASVRFRVRIDGQPPEAAHGIDVDQQGNGTITEQRLYQLIRQPGPIADRYFQIEFLDPGAEVFAFTFG
jgi:thiol-disulfide isomerase/thioredoxin